MKVWCVYAEYDLVAKFYDKDLAEDYCGENVGLHCECIEID